VLQAEREARESIRTEQDAAYKESLEADRKKVCVTLNCVL
jgi:hypothetical protein